jgi:arginase family enzyme
MPVAQFKRVKSHEEITPFTEGRFNYPEIGITFTRRDFELEFDNAHDVLIRWLTEVGTVVEGAGEGDFSLYRYVDPNRAITIVLQGEHAFTPSLIKAVLSALSELTPEYIVQLDAHPVYVCIIRDGRVLGYEPAPDRGILTRLGFESPSLVPI